MKIKERVAQNLKFLTSASGTAAYVSRKMGINPMQYGRYLSGQQMPNDATMERICAFFEIEELDLIKSPPDIGDALSCALEMPSYKKLISSSLEAAKSQIEEGWYFVYAQSEHFPEFMSRSPMVIKEENEVLTFRRFTAIAERTHPKFRNVTSDNHGVISATRHQLYFGSIDLGSSKAPNLMAGKWSSQAPDVFVGLGVSLGPNGIVPMKFAVKKLKEKLNFPQLMRMSVILPRDSNEIPRDVTDALNGN